MVCVLVVLSASLVVIKVVTAFDSVLCSGGRVGLSVAVIVEETVVGCIEHIGFSTS